MLLRQCPHTLLDVTKSNCCGLLPVCLPSCLQGTGPAGFNPANPQTVYAFDVVTTKSGKSGSFFPTLRNRRTFAVAETGLPDGIKLDVQGNVYTGTGAGVEVFAPSGKRLGSILIEGGVANLVFADKVLYALNEKRIIAVQLKVPGAKLP
jgi:gluconolactonase